MNASAEGEPETVQDQVQALEKTLADRIADVTWLNERFPEGVYADVAGLCKLASQEDIKDQDYSLTPGRYVGVEEINSVNENVAEQVLGLLAEIDKLNDVSQLLHNKLALNLKELF